MLKSLYKRVVKKLNLSREQLWRLKSKLTPNNICAGPFVMGSQMCPNTTALSIKLDRHLKNNEVKSLLRQNKISDFDLVLFYFFFDLPALISNSYFENSLVTMRQALEELEKE